MSSVWVLNPSGRQIKVNTNPTKTVLAVIEEVCSKSDINPNDFDLVTAIQRRPIDATQQWRFTSIPKNAKLELVKSTKPRVTSTLQVKVALQTPTGRLIGNVTTDQIIFNVLRKLKMEYPGPDQFPVVSFSGKECSLDKTLKQIGVLSGNVLFRIHFRSKTAEDDEFIKNIESAESTQMSEVNEPKKKIPKVDEMDTSGSISASNTIKEKMRTSEVPSTSKLVERLPCGAKPVFADFKFDSTESMEVEEKVERLPCGLKPTFSDFKFPEPGTSTVQEISREKPNRLPNGQKAQFSDFKFEDKPSSSKVSVSKPKSKEEQYPFLNFKFPDNPVAPIASTEDINNSIVQSTAGLPVITPADRKLKVYDNNEIIINGGNDIMDVDDGIFDVTVDDLKRIKASGQEKESLLMTKELKNRNRQRQRIQDYERYPECLLKINFVNNITVEMVFHPGETISSVQTEISAIVENGASGFELFTTPPKTILGSTMTIWDAGLCPRGNCYVSNKEIVIKPNVWASRITQLDISPEKIPNTNNPGASSTTNLSSSSQATSLDSTSNSINNTSNKDKYSSKSDGKKVPKWFKGTGKSYK